jgi:hypothetical protein
LLTENNMKSLFSGKGIQSWPYHPSYYRISSLF